MKCDSRPPERSCCKPLTVCVESGTLAQKEADAVEAAIEDELIALRVGPRLGGN
jgi:hypothetical protein